MKQTPHKDKSVCIWGLSSYIKYNTKFNIMFKKVHNNPLSQQQKTIKQILSVRGLFGK